MIEYNEDLLRNEYHGKAVNNWTDAPTAREQKHSDRMGWKVGDSVIQLAS